MIPCFKNPRLVQKDPIIDEKKAKILAGIPAIAFSLEKAMRFINKYRERSSDLCHLQIGQIITWLLR